MSRYATWSDEPPIYQKVNALGGTPRPNNSWDQGYNAAIDGALGLIEADPMTNTAPDLLTCVQSLLALHTAHHNAIEHAHARKVVARALGETA